MEALQEELKLWKKKCEEAQAEKRVKYVEKTKASNKYDDLENEQTSLEKKKKKIQEELKELQTRFNGELLELQRKQIGLKDEVQEFQHRLDESEETHRMIQQTLMVNSRLPPKNINFKAGELSGENHSHKEPEDITYTCNIISGEPFILGGGEALLTFEDAQVAKSVIAKKKHSLEIHDRRVTVDALEPPLPKSVKFEVNMNISRNKVNITNLPNDIPEEILKDKVELTFYKSNVGGAEIEKVDYNRENNTACVTYLQNGVAQRVLKNDFHMLMAGETLSEVGVTPCVDMELNKLQMSSAISERSVKLTGIKNVDGDDEDDVQDMIQIHFQKESYGGGEVENIIFSEHSRKALIFEVDVI